RLDQEWREFDQFVQRLEMPFFYVPGNHDVQNRVQTGLWNERYGRTYYHFIYKDVLFLLMNSDDNAGNRRGTAIQPEQIAYFKKVLAENTDVRWTFVAIHKPVWTYAEAEAMGWLELEQALADRPYTVFAGHVHRYERFVRQGRNYYQFATTGGGSKLRGERFGEFDHVVQVTMKPTGPLLANIMLDGVFPEDLTVYHSDEPGVDTSRRQVCVPARGRVLYRGQPIADARVALMDTDPRTGRPRQVADGLTDAEGRFTFSTYTADDGAPVGEYKIAISARSAPMEFNNRHRPNRLPSRYADVNRSGLTAVIKDGDNDLLFTLTDEQ
ncbi:MAG TPA: metallophosphoesterase, partial [Gemmatales bacterium]|nr:metallophosphoesterase [Gemmatales bacterium]